MSGYILSVPAQEDLAGILDYYFEEAGYRISRTMAAGFVAAFRNIAKNPGIGHRRGDWWSPARYSSGRCEIFLFFTELPEHLLRL